MENCKNQREKDLSKQEYFSISELAERWRCSRGTVYNRLRATRAEVLDFASRGKKGEKGCPHHNSITY